MKVKELHTVVECCKTICNSDFMFLGYFTAPTTLLVLGDICWLKT